MGYIFFFKRGCVYTIPVIYSLLMAQPENATEISSLMIMPQKYHLLNYDFRFMIPCFPSLRLVIKAWLIHLFPFFHLHRRNNFGGIWNDVCARLLTEMRWHRRHHIIIGKIMYDDTDLHFPPSFSLYCRFDAMMENGTR